MANFREIVTKTVIGKGKKTFTTSNKVTLTNKPSTILGCWVINHNFKGNKNGEKVAIDGSYDVNIWYSYDNDTKTDVVRNTDNYNEVVTIKNSRDIDNEEVIIRSLKQPNCIKVDISGNDISYTVEKELGIELIGDEKVRIETQDEDVDSWDEILDDNEKEVDEKIDNEVKEDYIDEQAI